MDIIDKKIPFYKIDELKNEISEIELLLSDMGNVDNKNISVSRYFKKFGAGSDQSSVLTMQQNHFSQKNIYIMS